MFWIVYYSIMQILSSHHLNRLHSACIYSGVFSCFFTAPVKCKSQFRRKYSSPSTPICRFAFSGFSYLQSTVVQKYEMENSRKKQFINFKLHTMLSILMKSPTVLSRNGIIPLCNVSTLYMLYPPISHLAFWVIRSAVTVWQCLCSGNPYFT